MFARVGWAAVQVGVDCTTKGITARPVANIFYRGGAERELDWRGIQNAYGNVKLRVEDRNVIQLKAEV
jgi:hypothetical protein